jgi:DNA ligase-1
VFDGEAVALAPDGRPRPFQVTASRTGSHMDVARQRADTPLTPFFFDLLHLDGADLIDEPAHVRQARLAAVMPADLLVPRLVTGDADAAGEFFADAVRRGHEGVVVKAPDGRYAAGRRGSEWIKVKPRHTLDLVILAAEWGHGRRRGWLSNLHLGARDPDTGGLVMLGKTFKGLTDEMLTWQTNRLLELADPPGPVPAGDRKSAYGVVRVRPELVVEIAFDGVQASPRYPGGVALRFARVLRHRPDKPAAEADTIGSVLALWAGDEAGKRGPE